MSDTETLRAVLRFVSGTLEIAEKYHDAATVCVLTQIIEIIEEGGIDADTFAICDYQRSSGGATAGGMATSG